MRNDELNDELNAIVTRLQELSLQRQDIQREEAQLLERLQTHLTSQNGKARQGQPVPIPQAAEPPAVIPPEPVPAAPAVSFMVSNEGEHILVGSHVRILSRIRHVPPGRRTTDADRSAIVTHFRGEQVWFRTYNGDNTWRAPRNLQ